MSRDITALLCQDAAPHHAVAGIQGQLPHADRQRGQVRRVSTIVHIGRRHDAQVAETLERQRRRFPSTPSRFSRRDSDVVDLEQRLQGGDE